MKIYLDYNWNYNEAISWMRNARESLLRGGEEVLGLGSHSSNIITIGRHALEDQLGNKEALKAQNINIHRIERGGGATVHGPGQLMVYPIINLRSRCLAIPEYTNLLEQIAIDYLHDFNIDATRNTLGPGVYVENRKIASVGFHVSKGVTTHGMCLNLSNDLSIYSLINPCGVVNAAVTSLLKEVKELVSVQTAAKYLINNFAEDFSC